MVLKLYPNGGAALTAILSMMKNEKTDDPKYHWFEQEIPDQTGAATGIYGGINLADAYAGTTVGDTFYVKMAAADAAKFNVTHQVMLCDNAAPSTRITAKVSVAPVINGANSYVTMILLEADAASVTGAALQALIAGTGAVSAVIIGSVNPEGGTSPSSLIYDPTEYYNQTQIFRTSLDMTRTGKATRLRTGDQVKEARAQALEMHSIEMEKAFLFSALSLRTGANGKPERTTKGIRNFLTTNVDDYAGGTSATWAQGGKSFLDNYMKELFKYGSEEKLVLCGNGAMLGIQQMVEANADMNITPGITSYGIKVATLVSVFGTLHFKMHPLFNIITPLNHSAMVLDPKYITYRYIDDTKYLPNRQANDLDGEKSEFLTEAGLELHFERSHGWLDNLGKDGIL